MGMGIMLRYVNNGIRLSQGHAAGSYRVARFFRETSHTERGGVVMGMRTIRWRNGQCPGRNGQWAERIAHAGSEAVRLVPFSSLPLSAEPVSSDYRSSA